MRFYGRAVRSSTLALALTLVCASSGYAGGTHNAGPTIASRTNHAETVLYRFRGGEDGFFPSSGLVADGGALYGTTVQGGGTGCGGFGCGTVFKITTSGQERVIHRFTGGTDGEVPLGALTGGSDGNNPHGALIEARGASYGTTNVGGGAGCKNPYSIGCGTVFAITPSGKERIVHRFAGPPADGENPFSVLIDVDGTLYGTTAIGGGTSCGGSGCGTVYSLQI